MNTLAQFFLFFSNGFFIICLLILGYLLNKNLLFFQAACIALISIVVNIALKHTFQIPLSPALHKTGFAFPSGHMQLASVLYGWIALSTRSYALKILILGLLTGIGFGLVHCGYHSWFDVLGAVFFASFILGVSRLVLPQDS